MNIFRQAVVWLVMCLHVSATVGGINVCTSPFPPMPIASLTTMNGLSCYDCEVANTTEISANTCKVQNCTGNGGQEDLGPVCYRWEFMYKGFEHNTIRTGCAVNCSSISYKTHMCSGVGENVFAHCDFTMCNQSLCNHGNSATLGPLTLSLTILFYLTVK